MRITTYARSALVNGLHSTSATIFTLVTDISFWSINLHIRVFDDVAQYELMLILVT